jgi:hypothetical protein
VTPVPRENDTAIADQIALTVAGTVKSGGDVDGEYKADLFTKGSVIPFLIKRISKKAFYWRCHFCLSQC